MLSNMISVILQFQRFILLNLGVTLAVGIILWFGTEKFGFQRRNRYIFAFFMGMTSRQILWVTVSWTWLMFVLSLALTGEEMTMVHLIFLLLLAFARLGIRRDVKALPMDLAGGVLLYLALLTAGVMREYLRMTRFDWMILLVCIALTLTAVHYTLYQFMKDMLYIAEERSKAHEKTDEI